MFLFSFLIDRVKFEEAVWFLLLGGWFCSVVGLKNCFLYDFFGEYLYGVVIKMRNSGIV